MPLLAGDEAIIPRKLPVHLKARGTRRTQIVKVSTPRPPQPPTHCNAVGQALEACAETRAPWRIRYADSCPRYGSRLGQTLVRARYTLWQSQ